MWNMVSSVVLLREDVISESFTLPPRFYLPRHRSCWRKPFDQDVSVVRNRTVPDHSTVCGPITLWPGSVFRICKACWSPACWCQTLVSHLSAMPQLAVNGSWGWWGWLVKVIPRAAWSHSACPAALG